MLRLRLPFGQHLLGLRFGLRRLVDGHAMRRLQLLPATDQGVGLVADDAARATHGATHRRALHAGIEPATVPLLIRDRLTGHDLFDRHPDLLLEHLRDALGCHAECAISHPVEHAPAQRVACQVADQP